MFVSTGMLVRVFMMCQFQSISMSSSFSTDVLYILIISKTVKLFSGFGWNSFNRSSITFAKQSMTTKFTSTNTRVSLLVSCPMLHLHFLTSTMQLIVLSWWTLLLSITLWRRLVVRSWSSLYILNMLLKHRLPLILCRLLPWPLTMSGLFSRSFFISCSNSSDLNCHSMYGRHINYSKLNFFLYGGKSNAKGTSFKGTCYSRGYIVGNVNINNYGLQTKLLTECLAFMVLQPCKYVFMTTIPESHVFFWPGSWSAESNTACVTKLMSVPEGQIKWPPYHGQWPLLVLNKSIKNDQA